MHHGQKKMVTASDNGFGNSNIATPDRKVTEELAVYDGSRSR